MKKQKKTIKVAAALIRKDDLVFATQRGYGDYRDWWEFPGGKVEPGETAAEALAREIKEELSTKISVDRYLTTVAYEYPEFHLSMDCFWCSIEECELTLLEHEAAKWLPVNDLRQVRWLPADVLVIDAIERGPAEQIRRIAYCEEALRNAERMLREEEELSGTAAPQDAAPDADMPVAENAALRAEIAKLEEYYGSPAWRQDYEDDEAGLIPADLPRGVLSEDGIFNVLTEYGERVREEIRTELFRLRDAEYGAFQVKLIPNVDPEIFIGVRTPDLRALAKRLRNNADTGVFLADLPHRYFDETQLHAFIISEEKSFDLCVEQAERFLPYVDNWATCDQLSPKVFGKYTEELLPYIRKWIASGETYTVRFGIGMLMQHYLDAHFDPAYPAMVAEVRSDEYYVNMMIAWYFATALAKQYDAVIPYIEEQKLDVWTHNKAIQKCVESRRISDEEKAYLRTLKR